MRDDGEPIGRGRLDRRAEEARALRGALFAVALFTGVVVVNGLLALLLIELFQVIGWWGSATSEIGMEATHRVVPSPD
jgi:hypothetical protein